MRTRRALEQLLALLRGEPRHDVDWHSVLSLANRTLATPALSGRAPDDILPPEVKSFLRVIEERTKTRNERMLAQLDEAAAALNAVGVEPIVLKGAALLVSGPEATSVRLLADLDLLVDIQDVEPTKAELAQIGYRCEDEDQPPWSPHRLSRACDVGMIDLHSRLKASFPRHDYQSLRPTCSPVDLKRGRVLVPSAATQMCILIMHDQLQERDYWRGGIDLRHLLDVDALAARLAPSDWLALLHMFPEGHARAALRTQLLTTARLLGTPIPPEICRGFTPQLQYWRRRAQLAFPILRQPFTLATLLLTPPRTNGGGAAEAGSDSATRQRQTPLQSGYRTIRRPSGATKL